MNKPATPKSQSAANAMWGGAFQGGPAKSMAAINPSIETDRHLYRQDIRGSIAHAQMLGAVGIVTREESLRIIDGLKAVEAEIDAGKMAWKPELEDIHMHVEARLAELIGPDAGKLHTARSRNDQVATAFRLWVRDALASLDSTLQALQAALIARAGEHAATLMPGFTHLQPAQPVTLGHHLLAYAEMFGRDRDRATEASRRLNECPLGAAALAGTPHPIDRDQTAKSLGFTRPTANSLDSVSDRDFVLDALYAASTTALHLSRLAEELVLWAGPQYGFITLSDAFTTGSSIMPQKKNPDGAELVRGKASHIMQTLPGMLTMLKGLPLAYNKDTQEDKAPLMRALGELQLCLQVTIGMVTDFTAHSDAMRAMAEKGYPTATDLADWLVNHLGMPFREAHHVTARIVQAAKEAGSTLEALPLAAMQAVEPRITEDIRKVLSLEASLNARTSLGGTAPARVREAAARAKQRYLKGTS